MNFFEHQAQAHKATKKLVLIFIAAVTAIILTTYFLVVTVFEVLPKYNSGKQIDFSNLYWDPPLFWWVFCITITIVGLSALYKIIALAKGGSAVAQMLGGRQISLDSKDPYERRLLNVVSEMAIASGTPSPTVFILDKEDSINAFAAGFGLDDATIAVSNGTLKRLTRDELQGVVAHEFSHIFNGDMRLNIKLLGLLHGILALATIGRILMELSKDSRSRRRSNSKEGNPLAMILIFGLGLLAIGYIGLIFARIIQSAVSRQREYLADASAVQFTRNPEGIGGALKKIGGFDLGSNLKNPQAQELSHMFFANGISSTLLSLFATHPPLSDRIKRIDPAFRSNFEDAPELTPADLDREELALSGFVQSLMNKPQNGGGHLAVNEINDKIGKLDPNSLAVAIGLRCQIPKEILSSLGTEQGAISLLACLVVDAKHLDSPKCLELIEKIHSPGRELIAQISSWHSQLEELGIRFRLPLVELSIPTLRNLPQNRKDILLETLNKLALFDHEVDLFDYILINTVRAHILDGASRQSGRYRSFEDVKPALRVLVSKLAYIGCLDATGAAKNYQIGARMAQLGGDILDIKGCTLDRVDWALRELSISSAEVKERAVNLMLNVILSDRLITIEEYELFRAICEIIGVPLPVLVEKLVA